MSHISLLEPQAGAHELLRILIIFSYIVGSDSIPLRSSPAPSRAPAGHLERLSGQDFTACANCERREY